MPKIKVIQIAIAASTDDTWSMEYLDDKGRVWERIQLPGTRAQSWAQLTLPDEPQEHES